MANENSNVESVRSRSIFRHVRETIGGINRHRHHQTDSTPSLTLINNSRKSTDNLFPNHVQNKTTCKKSANISFTHHLSLLNQVKSHLTKSKKSHPAVSTSLGNEEFTRISILSINSMPESKSITPIDSSQDLILTEPLTNTFKSNLDEGLDMSSRENENLQSTVNRTSTPIHKTINRIIPSTRPMLTKSPSLTSIVTSISSTPASPENIYWVELCIQRGRDLAVKDLNGTSDPYVKVTYGIEEKHITNIVYKNLNPIWNEKISFFVYDLNIPIFFQIFDYDRIGRDESMGTTKLDLWKIPLEKLYQATLDLENEKRTDGKIGMLDINLTITLKSSEFRDEIMRTLSKQTSRTSTMTTNRFTGRTSLVVTRRTIDVFIIEGRNLRNVNGITKLFNPYIRLKFGTNKKYRTQTIKSTSNPKWHQSFIYDFVGTEFPPIELTLIDDTGVSGDFLGRGICNVNHLDEERTHRISIDLDDNAGVIDLFVTISGIIPMVDTINESETASNTTIDMIPSKLTEEDMKNYSFFSSLRSINPLYDVGKVEIKIYQARDLSAKDINGKSDPFCVVELDSNRLRTHTIYKTLDPIWNKSFIIPVQDIHSTLELTIFDEDMNKSAEFIGKIIIPLLAIKNGEKKWFALKDRKCILPVKGMIEIEATLIYTDFKAILRTFNPREVRYYQQDGKFRVGVLKQHINRVRNMLKIVVNAAKFINDCFQWENPLLSFGVFLLSLVTVWNFQLYMLPCALLLIFAWNAVIEYRLGLLGKPFATLGDETVSAVIQPVGVDEDVLDNDMNMKEQKRSLMSVIHSIQDTVIEVQGYIDEVASTLERIKNVFNFTVPWLSILAICILTIVSIILYYIPLRYLVLAFVINKFTKRFRKPKGYIDNNELADFLSRLPSDSELLQYREFKILTRVSSPKKTKRTTITTTANKILENKNIPN